MTADAQRWHTEKMQERNDFPRANTLGSGTGSTRCGATTVTAPRWPTTSTLLAANCPQINGAYARELNWGEFVHFWTGAAGVDLKAQATTAFGWSAEWEQQLLQARQEFPGVRY